MKTLDEMLWAIRDARGLSKNAKLAWVMLLSRGPDCRPSIRTVAADCGLSRPTLREAMAELEDAGWLKRSLSNTDEGDLDTYSYVIKTPGYEGVVKPLDHPEPETPSVRGGGKATDPPGGQVAYPGGQVACPEDNPSLVKGSVKESADQKSSADPRGTRIPENFLELLYADKSQGAWFHAECPDVDPRVENQKFMNFWLAKTGRDATKRDWIRTWRNWMLKAQQDAARYKPRPSAQGPDEDGWVQPVSPFRGLP